MGEWRLPPPRRTIRKLHCAVGALGVANREGVAHPTHTTSDPTRPPRPILPRPPHLTPPPPTSASAPASSTTPLGSIPSTPTPSTTALPNTSTTTAACAALRRRMAELEHELDARRRICQRRSLPPSLPFFLSPRDGRVEGAIREYPERQSVTLSKPHHS